MSEASKFWETVKNNLRSKNPDNKLMATWFDPTQLVDVEKSNDNCRFRLGVPTDLHKYWISENFFDRICQEISTIYQNPFSVELIVTGEHAPVESENPRALGHAMTQKDLTQSLQDQQEQQREAQIQQNMLRATQGSAAVQRSGQHDVLNPEYTFSTFVVGRNTEFVHAASHYIAENPGADGYNPLFILGPTGMGKTHLMNAVGNHIRKSKPNTRISYVSAEKFLNECVSGIRRNEMDKFRTKYREECDILLIDDIQILGRTEAVQEEFFHTLNHFFEQRRQIVVASDKMPKEINGLADRIRTRLEGGLIADIQMPEIETRVAILRYKAERKNIQLPEDVVQYIARLSKRSIRELEGNLNKLKMFTELRGLQISLQLAKEVLGSHDDTANISVEEIQKMVGAHFKIRMADLKSSSRYKPIVTARQVAMFLIKKYLNKSLQDIGRAFGGRDHTTVINALRKIENQLTQNSDLKNDINELERQIQNITGV